MRKVIGTALRSAAAALVILALPAMAGCSTFRAPGPHAQPVSADEIPLYEPVPDPLEPLNRSIGVANHMIMLGVITPTSKVYRFLLPLPVRDCIRRAGHNLAFPVRLANNLLQAEFEGAGVESQRFLVNTTLGVAGLFDPATNMGIGRSDEDLGQTLGAWGWNPRAYLMIPVLGPSNERDFLGRFGDAFLDPAEYFFPAAPFLAYNNIVYKVDPYHNLVATESDPYSLMRTYVSLERQQSVLDMPVDHAPEDEAVQTLAYAIYFKDDDFSFHKQARSGKVRLEAPGGKLPFSYWLQPAPAPMVYLLPGLGAHRLSHGNAMLARSLYDAGYSVATISNIMHPEFMKQGSSVSLPGYPPTDVQDVRRALNALREEMRRRHPGLVRGEALMGVSLGGFICMSIAAGEADLPPAERFDRYVAINTPIHLYTGLQRLDDYFKAPLEWNPDERRGRIEHALMKLKDLDVDEMDSEANLPFDSIEARFLIGFSFRMKLRDILFVSQRRENMGILEAKLSWLRRTPAYAEIVRYSFTDYLDRFLFPYYSRRDVASTRESFLASADLRTYTRALADHPGCRVVNNRNDFLASESDASWLESVFGPERLVLFDKGGHMGNLHQTDVQQAILASLEGMKE